MKKIIIVAFIFCLMTQTVRASIVQAPELSPAQMLQTQLAQDTVPELVEHFASQYHVSASQMLSTIECENKELDPTAQSNSHYTFSEPSEGIYIGEREQSFGIVMIHLPAHPEVTKAEAENPAFAVEFMAKYFSEGKQNQWSCYRKIYGN